MSKISLKHSGGNVVSLNSPTNAPGAADVAFKLPNADGSAGQFMKTDGSGNLAFAAAGGGKVLQFVVVELTSTTSWNSASYVDITGMTATINGVSSGSKIIIDFNLNLGRSHNTGALFKLFRDSTFLPGFSGGAFTFNQNEYDAQATYETTNVNFRFVDTHGQSAGSNITYKMQGGNGESSNYVNYLNRRNYNSTQRGGSLMTLTEISA